MMHAWQQWEGWLVEAVDYPLGWLLWLPRDLALVLFATATALLMTLVRRATTNQNLLHRCAADLRRLKELAGEARQARDKNRLAQLRCTVGMIKGIQLAADIRVLGAVIIPIAVLAIWASARFDYIPPGMGQDLIVRAYFPISSVDRITHLVPSTEFALISPAIQVIRSGSGPVRRGIAEWTLRPIRPADDVAVTIRHQGETVVHRLAIGRTRYLDPYQALNNDKVIATEVVLQQYNPLGLRFVSQWLGLPPWMIAYVILTLILVPLLKRLLAVA